jgi:hypothetical protein
MGFDLGSFHIDAVDVEVVHDGGVTVDLREGVDASQDALQRSPPYDAEAPPPGEACARSSRSASAMG